MKKKIRLKENWAQFLLQVLSALVAALTASATVSSCNLLTAAL